jgi:PhzF family phenazine biosynthesis protein
LWESAIRLPIYQVDAFTEQVFAGNPAAVCPMQAWLSDETLQHIAAENNLSETAFTVPDGQGGYELRWFTPTCEVDLCGHATLAAAWVLLCSHGRRSPVRFQTRSGTLTVALVGELLVMDFPALPPAKESVTPTPAMLAALGHSPTALFSIPPIHGADYFLATYEDAAAVASLRPDTAAMGALGANVLATAAGEGDVDFVSRFFAPASGVDEDPVTGSAHCTLAPFWAGRLQRTALTGQQLSVRGGTVKCEVDGDRVRLSGAARLYLRGEILVPGE